MGNGIRDDRGDEAQASAKQAAPLEDRKHSIDTDTEANGGTRSSPPRVSGDGRGEAKPVKAESADSARKAVDDRLGEKTGTS